MILARGNLWGRAAMAFVAGAGVALGQVPFSLWYLALPALAFGLWLIAREERTWPAALLGLAFGTGHFALALHWITEPCQVDAARHGWMAPFALVLMALGMALFWALAAGLAARLARHRPTARVLLLVAALAGAEALRGHILTGFPWTLIGHIWIGWAPMQVAALVGAYGLTLLTLLAAAGPALAPRAGTAAGVVLLAALAGFGQWRQAQPLPEPPGPVVRLVQPNAAQHLKWDPEMARAFFLRQLDFTAAPSDRRPDLVIWPETAVPFLLEDPGYGLQMVAEAAGGVPVALGIQRGTGWRYFNSLAVIGAEAEVLALYDKHHLVPFGEYFPLGDLAADLFGLTAFAAQQGNGYSAGPGPELIDFGPLGRALPLICYEAVFPQDIRAAPARPDWLLHVTNDAWFGDLAGPWQHLAQAQLRAVETGLPLLRAANTGITAAIDAHGRILDQIGLNEAGFIDTPLPAILPAPPYARLGEWPFLTLLAGVVAAGAMAARRRERH